MENENNITISRETYKKIKSFNRQQMQQFITDVRNSSDTAPVDLDKYNAYKHYRHTKSSCACLYFIWFQNY